MNNTTLPAQAPAPHPEDAVDAAFWFGVSLGGAYLLLCITAFVLFARVHYFTKSCTKQKSVQGIIILSAALRTSFWALALLN